MKHFIRTACAAALLVSGLAAEAGTVKFNSWAYGNGNTVNVSTPNFNGQGGAFSLTLSGFGAGFDGAFEAYCVELTEYIGLGATYTSYNLVTAVDYFTGKGKAAAAGALTRLISYVNNSGMLANTAAGFKDDQSTALQLAIWNTVYDTDATLDSGSFAESSGTAYRHNSTSFGATNFWGANSLLSNAGTASGYSLYVLQSVGTPGQQDQLIWVRNQVPEPGSLALVALALGGAGLVARRRKV
jgi:hypothetical protein